MDTYQKTATDYRNPLKNPMLIAWRIGTDAQEKTGVQEHRFSCMVLSEFNSPIVAFI